MTTTRRKFIQLSAMAGGGVGLGMFAAQASRPQDAATPMRILILGGTGFIGPHQVSYAVGRGHAVTVFNRGKTNASALPAGVEQLIGDRDGQLDALRGRKWDVVVDNPTTVPAWVRDAAQILKGNVERYVFISTISVYASNRQPNDETSPLAKYGGKEALSVTAEAEKAGHAKLYGPMKAAAEAEAEKWFPGKTLIIRPGLMVGPGDPTDRFTYWPVRIDRGGEVLAPGTPADPVQFVDARDVAQWTIRMIEQRAAGIYNATGPASPMGMGEMLAGISTALDSDAQFTWADAEFLRKRNVAAWSDMPVWIRPQGSSAAMPRTSIKKALAAGLTFRPLEETARDTLAWFKTLPEDRRTKLKAGLSPERERALLAEWHKSRGRGA
jgi:2'-hydroxyisoflavone reductase